MSRRILCAVAGLAAALAVAAVIGRLERAPRGPVEPAWDRQACAHCRMHLSEHGFAAQLQSAEGEVFFFDDPGCLFLWQAEGGAGAAAIYFHHLREERWLAAAEAGFVRVAPTPMGWGFGAVERGAPGAIAPDESRRAVLAAAGGVAPAPAGGGHGQPAH